MDAQQILNTAFQSIEIDEMDQEAGRLTRLLRQWKKAYDSLSAHCTELEKENATLKAAQTPPSIFNAIRPVTDEQADDQAPTEPA